MIICTKFGCIRVNGSKDIWHNVTVGQIDPPYSYKGQKSLVGIGLNGYFYSHICDKNVIMAKNVKILKSHLDSQNLF